MSLAEELRPKTFAEVIGNSAVVESLQRLVASGNIPTAILLAGPFGCGKTTLAQILAEEIQGEFRGQPGLNILYENAADKNGIDSARRWAADAAYHPMVGLKNVHILDEFQRATPQANSALLLPTEQKGSATVWIFPTSDPGKFDPALRQRCLEFPVRPLGAADIELLVRRACDHTFNSYDPEVTAALIKHGVTAPRQILNVAEKVFLGIPLAEAIQEASTEPPPEFVEIAKAAVNGNWSQFKWHLSTVKPSASKALRGIVAGFARGSLLNAERVSHRTDSLANLICELAATETFEDGLSFAAFVAAIYKHCQTKSESVQTA